MTLPSIKQKHDYSVNKYFLRVTLRSKGYVEVTVILIITNKGASNYRRLVSPVDICCMYAGGPYSGYFPSVFFWVGGGMQNVMVPLPVEE